MRADREFGCDEIALQHLQGQSPEQFGGNVAKDTAIALIFFTGHRSDANRRKQS